MSHTQHTQHTLRDLKHATLAELEQLYVSAPRLDIPPGVFRGHYLIRIPNEGSRRWVNRLLLVPFQIHFGVDTRHQKWFFGTSKIQLGSYRVEATTSRWRDTETNQLHYDGSGLPAWIREGLYDELKPLNDRLLLGMGGVNAERGKGDLFFFALG